MTRSRLVILVCAAALVTGLLYYFYAGSNPPPGQQGLVRLDSANFSEFRKAFNDARGNIRIIALLSPT